MACNGILLKGPDGEEFCIPIYREYFKFLDPVGPVVGPSPEPWKEFTHLSAINEMVLSSGLSERVRAPLQHAIRSVSADLQKQLPKGYSVQLRGQEQEQCSE